MMGILESIVARMLARAIAQLLERAQDSSNTLVTRYGTRSTEIQWRGIQRDGWVIFAIVVAGTVLTTATNPWVCLGTPLLLMFVGAVWKHHDRRIGSAADYLRRELEPKMSEIDGVLSYEAFLDNDRYRRSVDKHGFTAVCARMVFPTLQAGLTIGGGILYVTSPSHPWPLTTLTVLATLANMAIIAVTWTKVKHERPQSTGPTVTTP